MSLFVVSAGVPVALVLGAATGWTRAALGAPAWVSWTIAALALCAGLPFAWTSTPFGTRGATSLLLNAYRREGLETAEQQIGFVAGLSDASQVQFLDSTLKDLPKAPAMMEGMVAAWSKGDPVKLAEYMNEGLTDTPELAQTLLYDRNARWARWIKARLARPGTVFVAVGAGHLAGAKSVIEQLKALGLRATRVAY